jgi:hypothetical protein
MDFQGNEADLESRLKKKYKRSKKGPRLVIQS